MFFCVNIILLRFILFKMPSSWKHGFVPSKICYWQRCVKNTDSTLLTKNRWRIWTSAGSHQDLLRCQTWWMEACLQAPTWWYTFPEGSETDLELFCFSIHFQRDPFARLPKESAHKLVVAMFAWDGNSYVGKEYKRLHIFLILKIRGQRLLQIRYFVEY